jgi:hypothetical protein
VCMCGVGVGLLVGGGRVKEIKVTGTM